MNRRLPARRRLLLAASAAAALTMTGCAVFGLRAPVDVIVVGIEPIAGEGMEARFTLKLRVQNPNEQPIEYDGIQVELDVHGSRLASGVSDERGSVPRFGERLVIVPMSVSVVAVLREALDFAISERVKTAYTMRGRLAGPGLGFGGVRFESRGELRLPARLLQPAT